MVYREHSITMWFDYHDAPAGKKECWHQIWYLSRVDDEALVIFHVPARFKKGLACAAQEVSYIWEIVISLKLTALDPYTHCIWYFSEVFSMLFFVKWWTLRQIISSLSCLEMVFGIPVTRYDILIYRNLRGILYWFVFLFPRCGAVSGYLVFWCLSACMIP